MKISPKTLLAAALLTALPMTSAMACTVSMWSGTGTATTAANAGGPAENVARYSGLCALTGNSGEYVIDNSPGAESIYRARFYVLTRPTSGDVTIFRATAADNGAGAEVIKVDFDGTSLKFTQNGTAAGSVTGVSANKWYSVELLYRAGAELSATVAGAVSFTGSSSVTTGIGAGTVGSAVLGVVAGTVSGSEKFGFDAFESTRSETTAIGRLCRGDVNGSNTITVGDRTAVNTEVLSGVYASGQPDCNEDGQITVGDRTCVNNLILAGTTCG